MRISLTSSMVAIAAAAALGFALSMTSSIAAPSQASKVGDCFTKADVHRHSVDLASRTDCATPHAVQVIGGAGRPATVTSDPQLGALSQRVCSGRRLAPGIWPKQGAAIANALAGTAAKRAGGVLPALPATVDFGWVLADESLLCVVFPKAPGTRLVGDARLLGTTRTLPRMRTCYENIDATDSTPTVSCAVPHGDEKLLYFLGKLPVAYALMTDEQWAPFDKQCDALMDVLVGASRSDLKAVADASPNSAAHAQVYVACYAMRVARSDGTKPDLTAGTVVGLGTKPLSS